MVIFVRGGGNWCREFNWIAFCFLSWVWIHGYLLYSGLHIIKYIYYMCYFKCIQRGANKVNSYVLVYSTVIKMSPCFLHLPLFFFAIMDFKANSKQCHFISTCCSIHIYKMWAFKIHNNIIAIFNQSDNSLVSCILKGHKNTSPNCLKNPSLFTGN